MAITSTVGFPSKLFFRKCLPRPIRLPPRPAVFFRGLILGLPAGRLETVLLVAMHAQERFLTVMA